MKKFIIFSAMMWDGNVCCIWAGAGDFDTEGNFIWVASGRDIGMYFSSWANDQPDGGERESCLEIWSSAPNSAINWNDKGCHTRFNFVCMF